MENLDLCEIRSAIRKGLNSKWDLVPDKDKKHVKHAVALLVYRELVWLLPELESLKPVIDRHGWIH